MRAFVAAVLAAVIVVLAPDADAARRALVIGNGAYAGQPLANPVNDAADMAARLKALGFSVTLALNASRAQMASAILGFRRQLSGGDEAVVFYAGHGMQVRGQNWLIPVDADPKEEAEVEFAAVSLDVVLRGLSEAGVGSALVLLDACRNNPFEGRFRGGTRGLARVEAAASGVLVSYAAKPGTVAADGTGRNSPYTRAWLEALAEPGLSHYAILERVHTDVRKATSDRQETWQEGQIVGSLVLNAAAAAAASAAAPVAVPPPVPGFDPRLAEMRFWESAERGNSAAEYEAYLAQYPKGQFAPLAKARLAALKPPAPMEPPPAVEDRDATMVTTASANVRATPATTGEKLETLPAGTKVAVTGKVNGGEWYRIARPAAAGWVHGSLLADPATAGASAPQTPTLAGRDTATSVPQVARPVSPPTPGMKFRDCNQCPDMVWLPPGEFVMGSPVGEPGRENYEGPQHNVKIGYPLAVGTHEVTRGQFAAFVAATGHDTGSSCWSGMGRDFDDTAGRGWRSPGYAQDDRHPVTCVQWSDAKAYVSWLTRVTGFTYRLLSEAEWEYAARAGGTMKYPWGNDAGRGNANCNDCGNPADGQGTMSTGSFSANAFGLHDMVGNVWEWTEDCWDGLSGYAGAPADGAAVAGRICAFHVMRGGSWGVNPKGIRISVRKSGIEARDFFSGFRVARVP
ncbi:MAG: SUMF1/EgtB/PvdO family nonheme iron enzyme [Alphaproteobacteria bacterium]